VKNNAETPPDEVRFIVDHNVGKLARWLRMMGYDTLLFTGGDDSRMVSRAAREGRVILTRDRGIMQRRLVTSGRLRAMLISSEEPPQQMRQVINTLKLDCRFQPFSRCLECNHPLAERSPEEVRELVPPYVFKTQSQYMACPACGRIYWRGTHWEAMTRMLNELCDKPDEQ